MPSLTQAQVAELASRLSAVISEKPDLYTRSKAKNVRGSVDRAVESTPKLDPKNQPRGGKERKTGHFPRPGDSLAKNIGGIAKKV